MWANRFFKAAILAAVGCATAGGWLIVDLLLPEPIGDYLLYVLMAVVNGAIGWQVGRASAKRRKAVTPSKTGEVRAAFKIGDMRNQ
ncbi:MAG TPA: hypothetical protein VFK33_09090 [Bacillales bacterium]|nr:hypothetical protein [Bacillales bacterium]